MFPPRHLTFLEFVQFLKKVQGETEELLANICNSSYIEFVWIFGHLSINFEHNNLLSPSQFSFGRGISTVDTIDKLVEEEISGFEDRGLARATKCHLRKALIVWTTMICWWNLITMEIVVFKSILSYLTLTIRNKKLLLTAHGDKSGNKVWSSTGIRSGTSFIPNCYYPFDPYSWDLHVVDVSM